MSVYVRSLSARFFQVDAFTTQPLAGNPAAVVVLEEWPNDETLGRIARENNLSETAFLLRGDDRLRWFTPSIEVPLCGHATLAAAWVKFYCLDEVGGHASIAFATRSGPLTARERDGEVVLDFPSLPPRRVAAPEGLLAALGVGDAPVHFVREVHDRGNYLVELDDEAAVVALAPDHDALRSLGIHGAIVTAAAAPARDADFVSRYFAPGAGVPEDPVTGSAHCALAPFWSRKLDRDALVGEQLSDRPGRVGVRLNGTRVELSGSCVVVIKGELFFD